MKKFLSRAVLGLAVTGIIAGLSGCNSKPVVEGTPPATDTSNRDTGAK